MSKTDWVEVKPGQFHCLIRQCTINGCENWFLGTAVSRYCDGCKRGRYANMKLGWQRARRNSGMPPHQSSRFSEEEIREMRDMFFRHTAKEIAEHFGVHVSLIYRYQKKDPLRFRPM